MGNMFRQIRFEAHVMVSILVSLKVFMLLQQTKINFNAKVVFGRAHLIWAHVRASRIINLIKLGLHCCNTS